MIMILFNKMIIVDAVYVLPMRPFSHLKLIFIFLKAKQNHRKTSKQIPTNKATSLSRLKFRSSIYFYRFLKILSYSWKLIQVDPSTNKYLDININIRYVAATSLLVCVVCVCECEFVFVND